MSRKPTDVKTLPLHETLRDLALVRASGIDLSSVLPKGNDVSAASDANEDATYVKRSFEFVAEARKAIAIHNSGKLDGLGDAIEASRGKLDEALKGIES
ncbi:hypothetical protein HGRIS_002277 [Hohenbuehelia grisea]|uniref:Uncharacterized protein n=1 Tax=Hohenbuehelia grisea TaxID=104357 RepID=A0ABR3JKH0_9AGAR